MTHGAGNSNLVDEDVSFVAQMLGDAAALGPAVAAGTGARRAAHKRDRAAWASSQEAQPSDHDQALLARHNTPSSRSNSKLYHCEACDCPVGPHDRDWATPLRVINTSGSLSAYCTQDSLAITWCQCLRLSQVQATLFG